MAKGDVPQREVLFMCDASRERVTSSVFIVGDLPVLGAWKPNAVAMRDDGKDGDERAGDGIWTFRVMLPAGTRVAYKYTNSGTPGQWTPGDEFAQRNRTAVIDESSHSCIIRDTFGQYATMKTYTPPKALDLVADALKRKLKETRLRKYNYSVPSIWSSGRGKPKAVRVQPYAYYLGVVKKLKAAKAPKVRRPGAANGPAMR